MTSKSKDNAHTHTQQAYGYHQANYDTSMTAGSQYAPNKAPGTSWPSYHSAAAPVQGSSPMTNFQKPQRSSYGRGYDKDQSYEPGTAEYSGALNQERSGFHNVAVNGHNLGAAPKMPELVPNRSSASHQTSQKQCRMPQSQPQQSPQPPQHAQQTHASHIHGQHHYMKGTQQHMQGSNYNSAATPPRHMQSHPATSTPFSQAVRHSQSGEQFPTASTQQQHHHERSVSSQDAAVASAHRQQRQHVLAQEFTPQTDTSQDISRDYAQAAQTVDPSQVDNQRHELERLVTCRAEQEARNEPKAVVQPIDQNSSGLEPRPKPNKAARSSQDAEAPQPNIVADDMSAAMTLMQTANASNPNTSPAEKEALEFQMMEMFKKMREFNKKDPDMLARLWNNERTQHLAEAYQRNTSVLEPTSTQKRKAISKQSPKPKQTPATKQVSAAKQLRAARQAQAAAQSAEAEQAPASCGDSAPPRHNTVSPLATTQMPGTSKARSIVAVGTVWPPEQKGLLARAAVRFIKEDAQNQGKHITAAEISNILDTNPRYVELCTHIEAKGIILNRGSFAKYLLDTVPGPKGMQLPTSTARTGKGPSNAAGDSVAPSALGQSQNVTAQTKHSEKSPAIQKGNGTASSGPTRKSQQKSDTKKVNLPNGASINVDSSLEGLDAFKAFISEPEAPNFTPTTKTKGAKKKSRQRNSNEESATPQPQSKEELARKRTFGDLVDLTVLSESDNEVFYPPAKRQELGQSSDVVSSLPSPAQTDLDKAAEVANKTSTTDGIDLDRIGSRASKIPDITAILGPSHNAPSQSAGLPQPSTPQSTLQTAPPAPMQQSAPPPALAEHPARYLPLVSFLDRSKAFRRSEYDGRTIARDVLLACGRHPVIRPLNYHLEILKMTIPGLFKDSDLATIRWDVIDPGGPPPGSGVQLRPGGFHDLGHEADDEDGDDKDDDSVLGPSTDVERHAPSAAVTKVGLQRPSIMHSSVKRKKAAERDWSSLDPKHQTPSQAESRPAGTPQTASPGPGSGGYSALRQVDEQGNVIKKKGRPVGWRKWMQKTPTPSGKGPAGVKSKKPEPQPYFHMHKCEWRNCTAMLHNLDTLRNHVLKVHCNRTLENRLPCHWLNCGQIETNTDPSTGRTTSEFHHLWFTAYEDWKIHIEDAHISPIAWKYGDGPTAGVSDRDSELSEAYLSDRQGRQVTPRIVMPDNAESSSARPVKRTAEQEAQLGQDLATRRKRDAGPGVDKGGARLANEKRRQGFIDDETEGRVVDDDDD